MISSTFFPDYKAIIRNQLQKKKNCKSTNTWRLSSVLLNIKLMTEEIKRKQRKSLETNVSENTMTQNL